MGIDGSFSCVGNILNGNGKNIQSWDTRNSCEGIIKELLICPVVVFPHFHLLVPVFI